MVKGHDSQGVQGIAGVAFHISIKLTELRALIVPQNPLVSLLLRFAPPRTAPHCAASRRQEERTLRQYSVLLIVFAPEHLQLSAGEPYACERRARTRARPISPLPTPSLRPCLVAHRLLGPLPE